MKALIFSDLHANLFGLNKIVEFARGGQIDRIYCLGDMVGYHSYPSECIQLMRAHSVAAIKGNHEALLLAEINGFDKISVRAQHSLAHTRDLLNPEEISYLKQLPFSMALNGQTHLVHANYNNLTQTVNTVVKARHVFEYAIRHKIHLTFLGHTHRPGAYMTDGSLSEIIPLTLSQPLPLHDEKYYIINPGSAGEARHNLPLSFVVYDDQENSIKLQEIHLSAVEVDELKQHNQQTFGSLSLKQNSVLAKEKLRRFYYAVRKKMDL